MEWRAILETKYFSIRLAEEREERRQRFSETGLWQGKRVVVMLVMLVRGTDTRVNALVHDGRMSDIDGHHDRLYRIIGYYLCCFGCACKEG